MSETIAVRVTIAGRVQGVWFRGWTVEQATRRGLRGWVRNRRDGSVEALFIGPPDAVEAVIADCQSGPPLARVGGIRRFPADDDGPTGFTQLPTA